MSTLMEGRRFALIIANSNYNDPELSKLMAPADDAADLARVLENPEIGGFQIQVFHDQPAYKLSREIERFFRDRQHDDLLLLYFSGHGIKDLEGQLYLAAVDTELDRHQVLRATAISAKFVNEVGADSRARRQVMILDCCHSGAFKEGMLAKGSEAAGAEQFQGRGRVVLTASNALQYSFEGNTVRGDGKRSIFTRTLVHGLETGEADINGDGLIDIDDIYSYVCDRLRRDGHAQQPMRMGVQEGDIVLGANPRPNPTSLPDDLLEDLSHDRREMRLGAVNRLNVLLQADHKGRQLAAYDQLIRLLKEDDSLQVREAAKRYVEQYDARAKADRQAREEAAAAEQGPWRNRLYIWREMIFVIIAAFVVVGLIIFFNYSIN